MLNHLILIVLVVNFALAVQSVGLTTSMGLAVMKQNDSAIARCPNFPPGFVRIPIPPGMAYYYCCYPAFIPRQILVHGEMRPVGEVAYGLRTVIDAQALPCGRGNYIIRNEKLYADEDASYRYGPVSIPAATRTVALAITCNDLVNDCIIDAFVAIDVA